ncbi:hypothetical protein LTR64_004452 [Lithohypha guttulata]|uniref:uncharacterized protein n=1 Tax=Lithohypha guttulata TaxID=1690604 RepID=UPI00315C4F4B
MTRDSVPTASEYTDLGSPDPLADSPPEDSTVMTITRSRSKSRTTADGEALYDRRSKSAEVNLSPSKMVFEQNMSPLRIKVTVEAESEDAAGQNAGSRRRQTITRTMKVPLKDASSPTKSDKSTTRSRPRKSSGSGGARGRRRRSITNLDVDAVTNDANDEDWTAKLPRKRGTSTKRTTHSSRKSSSNVNDFRVREDESSVSAGHEEDEQLAIDASPTMEEVDLNSVSTRPDLTIAKHKDHLKNNKQVQGNRKVSVNSAASYPTPSPTASDHRPSDNLLDEGDHLAPAGLDTVMESEAFTMIDLDTLPSVRHMKNTPDYPTIPALIDEENEENQGDLVRGVQHSNPEEVEAPSIAVTQDETDFSGNLSSSPLSTTQGQKPKPYSIAHLQLPSSTNVQRHRLVTPMPVSQNPFSSPKLPSPPRAPISESKDRPLIHSDDAVQATNTLHHAVTPEKDINNEKNDIYEEALFGGFSRDTRRELRAELRFGEELGKRQVRAAEDAFEATQAELEEERRQDRLENIEQAKQTEAVIVMDDDCPTGEHADDSDGVEDTMGDIWLAEAKKPSSSPKELTDHARKAEKPIELPKRRLIPSPWKRGQQIEESYQSADESITGLFWKHTANNTGKRVSSSDRRRSGMYDAEHMVIRTPRRLTEREEPDNEDQDLEDENFDVARGNLQWRTAADVVEEETNELEAGQQSSDPILEEPHAEVGTTKLYETNLDDVPEQDLLSPSQGQSDGKQQQQDYLYEHDSTYSSISDHDSPEPYRQRTSLPNSKERPHTPRSALKGGRGSFGQAIRFGNGNGNGNGNEDTNMRKVVWAKRSSCMNEQWEESTTSVRSSQTTNDDETPTPRPGLQLEASFQVDPQPPIAAQAEDRGWFGWFSKSDQAPIGQSNGTKPEQNIQVQHAPPFSALDGSSDESSFVPTSRHTSIEFSVKDIRTQNQKVDFQPIKNHDGHLSRKSASPSSSETSTKTTSYLLAPSYPSDPSRDASIPMNTSGDFTDTHFRTLQIISRKSKRARFHAPEFPGEIRPGILELVGEENWKLKIDESPTMGEDGLFEFAIGATEARVLERFMREVEHGYGQEEVEWGWSIAYLAEKLGRLVVGEIVRREEKEAARIMDAVKGLRA